MSNSDEHSDRVMNALTRLLAQKDEIKTFVQGVSHQQQLLEQKTTAEFDRVTQALTGINRRVTNLEKSFEEAEDTKVLELRRQLDEERARSTKVADQAVKAVGAVVMMVVGGIVSFLLRKVLG